jgi:hypothetical protein
MPTPMPAFAPVDNPVSGLVCAIPLTNDPLAPVLIADSALVPLAQYNPVPKFVQVKPLSQQPPPIEAAQLNCPVVQPLGTIDTSVVGAADGVETHACPLEQEKPRLQHPPPYELALAVQGLRQQVDAAAFVTETVAVPPLVGLQ